MEDGLVKSALQLLAIIRIPSTLLEVEQQSKIGSYMVATVLQVILAAVPEVVTLSHANYLIQPLHMQIMEAVLSIWLLLGLVVIESAGV